MTEHPVRRTYEVERRGGCWAVWATDAHDAGTWYTADIIATFSSRTKAEEFAARLREEGS
jgi:hypothetical protein